MDIKLTQVAYRVRLGSKPGEIAWEMVTPEGEVIVGSYIPCDIAVQFANNLIEMTKVSIETLVEDHDAKPTSL